MSSARRQLSPEQLNGALAALVGERVSVRIVELDEAERLIAVMEGVLGACSPEKSPSRFWPLEDGLETRERAFERFGFLIHEGELEAEARAGGEVIVIAQAGVIVNLRRL